MSSSHSRDIDLNPQIYNICSDIDVSVLNMESKQADNLPIPPPFYDNLFPIQQNTVRSQESHMVGSTVFLIYNFSFIGIKSV